MPVEPFTLILSLLQQMCVYLVIAYLLSRTPLFLPLTHVTVRWPHKLACYVIFSIFCIMGPISACTSTTASPTPAPSVRFWAASSAGRRSGWRSG
ncbi:hypothetical protein [Azospirillum sp. INR13]|uniref:hypothetical protein n=1 Tax=Azospirillum sp. INR13 TaxID=2596919 RepID=UPI0027145125|nr:hypothetical protein [Azospirillum sp. INR13]